MATMPNVGPLELAIVLIIALVIVGPKRLHELGRSLGNGLREFKSSVTGENKDDDKPPLIENGDADEDPVAGASVGDAAAAERSRETHPGS